MTKDSLNTLSLSPSMKILTNPTVTLLLLLTHDTQKGRRKKKKKKKLKNKKNTIYDFPNIAINLSIIQKAEARCKVLFMDLNI